ncbi:MAG TPA: hypothetical protein VMZ52_05825 [Bryobacteraceae bacterium]|nr:hypothetical protein [Bryobacteraceae bacterium]
MHTDSYIFRKCALAAIAAAALLTIASPAGAQVDLGLTPMRVEIPAVAGKAYSGSLSLSNAGTAKARVRVEMVDFYVDENMTPQFVGNVPGEAEYSCRSWLSANPMEVEVEPRSQVTVRYTVRTPAAASERSYHCALGFRSLPSADPQAGTAMRTAVRLITVFYATVGKPPVVGTIKDLKLEPVAPNLWRAVLLMENAGLMLYRPVGDVQLVNEAGKVVESQAVSSFPVLPKRTQRFLLPMKNLSAGAKYTLRARIEVAGEIQEGSAVVTAEAPPTATAAAELPGK